MSAAAIAQYLDVPLGKGLHTVPLGRDALPLLFEALGCRAGAEVGVERGHFTKKLLTDTTYMVYAIDAWEAYRGYREHVSQSKLDMFYAETKHRLEAYWERCVVMKTHSLDAASNLRNSLDFVYLDANHTLPHVIADLAAWTPTLRPGGVMCGHDYRRYQPGYPCHVIEAVTAWRSAYFTPDDPWFLLTKDKSPSFLWSVA